MKKKRERERKEIGTWPPWNACTEREGTHDHCGSQLINFHRVVSARFGGNSLATMYRRTAVTVEIMLAQGWEIARGNRTFRLYVRVLVLVWLDRGDYTSNRRASIDPSSFVDICENNSSIRSKISLKIIVV